MLVIAAALLLGLAAGDDGAMAALDQGTSTDEHHRDCPYEHPDAWMELDDEDSLDAWGGFQDCRHVRCDAASGVLWMNVQNQKVWTDRETTSKGHQKMSRSYCMVFAPDGRRARYARGQLKRREERFMWRERQREVWHDIPHANGTLEADPWWGSEAYGACLDRCGGSCAALGSDETFDRLREDTLGAGFEPGKIPSVCFEDATDWTWYFGWITPLHAAVIVLLALTLAGAWCLGCCVSNKCCVAYEMLQRLRHEFADSCPCLAKWLRFCCVVACTRCAALCSWCKCLCCAKRKSRPEETTIELAAVADVDQLVLEEPDLETPLDAPAAKPRQSRALLDQVRLLVWKAWLTKTRDRASLLKQVAMPALVFAVIWLLYVAGGLTFVTSLRWNKKNGNYVWKDGDLRDYEKGQFLSHGDLELYLGFLGFIPFVQVVVVTLVNEHQAKLVEYMKMAGLRAPAYWLANFAAEGLAVGFAAAFLVACVGAPGLFDQAGHAENPFFVLLGLHWCYLVALTAVGFAAAALVPNALVAALFAVASQVAGVVCYFVGAWREQASGGLAATGVWNKSVGAQRAYALWPQFGYMLLVDGFQAHRERRCRVVASYESASFASEEYKCRNPAGKSLENAKPSALDALRAWLDSVGAASCAGYEEYFDEATPAAACGVDGPYSVYRSFYDDDTGAPRAQWTAALYGILLADVLVYLALAWYFAQVIPWSEYGTPRPWYFPLAPSTYGFGQKEEDVIIEEKDEAPAAYEPLKADAAPVVTVRGLRKTFGEFRAVDGVTFDMVESEVFCLLGHNGAGKTTTIAMLSGLTRPDPAASPRAVVYGYDVADPSNLEDLRRVLGVCPQHDVLFEHLTLREHVEFFGRLKGRGKDRAAADAAALLDVFRLGDRAEHLGGELSGGQRRKLSVAVALAGASKFVVLDEPTAGMDPVARRELWTLLRAVRKSRALLLTTHHMDEAEALGDRVAVMAAGRVKADGSVAFLKRAFGKGYAVEFDAADADAAAAAVARAAPAATREDLGEHAAVGLKTRHAAESFRKSRSKTRSRDGSFSAEELSPTSSPKNPLRASDGGDAGPTRLAYALPFDAGASLPGLFEALRGVAETVSFATTTLEDVFLAVGEDDAVHNVARVNKDDEDYATLYDAHAAFGAPRSLLRHGAAITRLRGALALNDAAALLLPLKPVEYAATCGKRGPIARVLSERIVGARSLVLALLPAVGAVAMGAVAADGALKGPSRARTWGWRTNLLLVLPLFGLWVLLPGLLAEPMVRERKTRLRNLLAVSGLDARAYWLGSMAGDLVPLFFGVAVTWVALAAFGVSYTDPTWAPKQFDDDGLTYDEAYAACLEDGDDEDCSATKMVRERWLEAAPGLIGVYALFPFALVAFSHLSSYAFRDPNVCVGAMPVVALVLLLLPLVLIVFLWLAFGGVMPGSEAGQLFNWNFWELLAAFAWLGSLVSPVNALAMALLRAIQLNVAGIPLVATKSGCEECAPTWPGYGSLCAILGAQCVVFGGAAYVKDRLATRPLAYRATRLTAKKKRGLDPDVAAERDRVLALFAADAAVPAEEEEEDAAPGLVTKLVNAAGAVRDALADELSDASFLAPGLSPDAAPEDRDGLVVREVRKVFPPRRLGQRAVEAVQGATFGVRSGEVFGLLGANGAGKTTTMSVVMRALEPTSGDAAIQGVSVLSKFAEAAEALGVVNQHNTLWDALTCREHLELFGRLRLREADVAAAAAATLDRVELGPHAAKPAARLSGGMKRKLCCAAALVGDPSIVLLDEPSAGLDPVSQRNLWNLIKSTMAGRAVVLTTHSMVEADVLCDRIGIMVRGQLRCLGTPDHLKRRYASGYELVVKVDDGAVEDEPAAAIDAVTAFVTDRFGGTLASADAGVLTYELPTAARSVDLLASAFAAFDDDRKKALGVAELSVVQASLEKVFIRIVSGEGGEHAARRASLGRRVASDLGGDDDDPEDDLDGFEFRERTCCRCSYFAHGLLAKWHTCCCCGLSVYYVLGALGAPWVIFNTVLLTILLHLFSSIVACVGRCCLQEDGPEDS